MILWENGFIHTLKFEDEVYQKMATHDGHIIGFDDEIKDLSFDQVVDLKNNHLYPGFVDAHLHIVGYGQKLSTIDISMFLDKQALLSFLSQYTYQDYILFEGYHQQNNIHKDDLNTLFLNKPVILRHHDYHSVTVNDIVLSETDLKSETGYLTEDDAKTVLAHYQSYQHQDIVDMITTSIKKLHQFGITGGHSDDLFYFNGYHDTLDAYQEVLDKHPFRAHLLMHYRIVDDFVNNHDHFLDQNNYLQLGAVKIFYDGTLSSKTALLHHHYKDSKNQGLRIFSKSDLEELIIKMRGLNLPLAIHIIGDLALEETIELLKKYPPKKGLHDRIIHASLATLKTIKKMQDMPIIIDVQPQFITSDLPQILSLFSQKPDYIYPFKTFLNHHLTICGSSDAPVEIPNPLIGMHAAIYRKLENDIVFNKEEKLTRFEALKLYTTYANIPTYKSNRGLLDKGYIADFTVLSKDILKMDEKDYFNDIVKMTVVDEKIVYQDV